VWAARPEKRHLPTLPQWLDIRWLTAKKTWTPSQARMMAKAGRVHCFRGAVLGVALALATGTGLAIWERVEEKRKATQAEGMVQAVLNADTALLGAARRAAADLR
jgi:hypothetical protein